MIRFTLILCLVGGCLSQWHDPDWSERFEKKNSQQKYYQPLPGSILLEDKPRKFAPVILQNGAVTTTSRPTTTSATTPKPGTCPSLFSCADCNTALICHPSSSGQLIPGVKIPCPASKPFCDYSSGTCTNKPDYTRCGQPDTFLCMDNGYFPDPTNCSIYHVCNSYSSQKFFCVDDQIYDPDEQKCTSSNKYACSTASCTGVDGTGVKEAIGNTHFYAYCNNDSPYLVARCPFEYKLNSTSQNCEPLCESDGLMRDVANCNNYYKCTTIYLNVTTPYILRQNLPCPTGEAYEPSSFQCIPKTLTGCNS